MVFQIQSSSRLAAASLVVLPLWMMVASATAEQQESLLRHEMPPGMISKAQVPNTGRDWVTLDNGVEFQPGPDYTFHHAARILSANNGDGSTNFYEANPFIEGADIEFDEGQQSWRFVGWWIDCNENIKGAYGTADGGGNSHGSQSGDYEDDACQRYLMWAAYIDPYYEGGGIGEYQYYNTYNQAWDATPCNYGGGSGDNDGDGSRCAKMDCHEEDTDFELLGLFKHADYDEWFDQLFKHTGYCVWDSDAYEFMQSASRNIPRGCRDTGSTDSLLNPLYYALKPLSDGGMTIGIYKDTKCIEEYGGWSSLGAVLGGNILAQASHDSGDDDGDDDGDDSVEYTLSEALDIWTKHFDVWKVCHPCVAANLGNVGWDADDDASKGDRYEGYYDDGYFDDGYNGGDQDDFDCNDDAGYTNVNQCMKFMAKTNLMTATLQDYSLGTQQGSFEELNLSGYTTETTGDKYYSRNVFSKAYVGGIDFGTKFLFGMSIVVLGASVYVYVKARSMYKRKSSTIAVLDVDKPLVMA